MLSSATTVSQHYLQPLYSRSTANPWWVKEKEKRKTSVQTGNCVSFTGFLKVPSPKDGTIQIKRIFLSQRHIWFLLVRYESVGVGHDWCLERQLVWALHEQISVLLPLHTRTQTALSKTDNWNSQKSWSFSVAGCLPKLSGISRAPVLPHRMCVSSVGVGAILALCNLKMKKKVNLWFLPHQRVLCNYRAGTCLAGLNKSHTRGECWWCSIKLKKRTAA